MRQAFRSQKIATGSGNVFINGQPAARVDDKITCGAVITKGSGNVYIGGGTQQTDAIHPEELVPGWVHAALLVAGVGSAIVLVGPVVAVAGLVGGMAGGLGGEWVGGKVFGQGSDGQKWMMLGGSLLGGAAGAKGGPKAWNFAKRIEVSVEPGTLGMNGGNVKVGLKPEPFKTTPMKEIYIDENKPGHPIWTKLFGPKAKVKYLTDAELAKYKLSIKDGKIHDAEGNLFDTSNAYSGHSGSGKAIFVMDENGNIYASNIHKPGAFHHSSLAQGKPVAAAGELEVQEGILTAVSDQSGHYQPTRQFSDQAMQVFAEQGVDMRYVLPDFQHPPLPTTPRF